MQTSMRVVKLVIVAALARADGDEENENDFGVPLSC